MTTLTIFTPTYNRAHTLGRTYQSLLRQDCKDFIWLIIDDGSVDDTSELVAGWMKEENGFDIQYIYKENGGMHTAHNVAYENIDTELNMCIDSDDCLSDGAVRKIIEKWQQVDHEKYAGIIALDADMTTRKIIGTCLPKDKTETTLCDFYAKGGKGDKKQIYRTDVINSVPPYPVFEGEKYVGLVYKYRLIDQIKPLVILNEIVCLVDYQADGSSGTMFKQYLDNPKGFAFWRKTAMRYPETRVRLMIECVHYVSSSLIAGNRNMVQESPRKLLTVLSIPFGFALTQYIRWKAKAQSEG